jgi:hypothetical protein
LCFIKNFLKGKRVELREDDNTTAGERGTMNAGSSKLQVQSLKALALNFEPATWNLSVKQT